ncbi:MAG: hypothetical protein P1P89_13780 [Desulfobacterales bacterium]|nr:hypothetical protein [Desulfobacterales bacterium]
MRISAGAGTRIQESESTPGWISWPCPGEKYRGEIPFLATIVKVDKYYTFS